MKKIIGCIAALMLAIGLSTVAPLDQSDYSYAAALKTMRAGSASVSGVPALGETLTANTSGWLSGTRVTYAWYINALAITGATTSTFVVPQDWDTSATLSVRVTGSKAGYRAATAISPLVTIGAFNSRSIPKITGTPTSGLTLHATCGTWLPVPASCDYQWNVGDVPIAGETTSDLILRNEWAGSRVSVTATAHHAALPDSSATSASTVAVTGVFDVSAQPQVTGDNLIGSTLSVSQPMLTPEASGYSYQWYRGSTKISRATGST